MYDYELSRLMDIVDKLGELHTSLYNLGDDAEYVVETVPQATHDKIVKKYHEEQERLTSIINAHRAEIERLNTLMGGEMLVEDNSTTRTDAIKEVKSLRSRLNNSESTIEELRSEITSLSNRNHALQSRLNAVGSDLIDRVLGAPDPNLVRVFPTNGPQPPQGVDMVRDLSDNSTPYLARANPGTDDDGWIWMTDVDELEWHLRDGCGGLPWKLRAGSISSVPFLIEVK